MLGIVFYGTMRTGDDPEPLIPLLYNIQHNPHADTTDDPSMV